MPYKKAAFSAISYMTPRNNAEGARNGTSVVMRGICHFYRDKFLSHMSTFPEEFMSFGESTIYQLAKSSEVNISVSVNKNEPLVQHPLYQYCMIRI